MFLVKLKEIYDNREKILKLKHIVCNVLDEKAYLDVSVDNYDGYEIDYAGTSRAVCLVCKDKILVGTERIEIDKIRDEYGSIFRWCHAECITQYTAVKRNIMRSHTDIKFEIAPSSRCSCHNCGNKIAKGDKRVKIKNRYWAHYDCENAAVAEKISVAPSSRGTCIKCKQTIHKGQQRYKYDNKYCHIGCKMGRYAEDAVQESIKKISREGHTTVKTKRASKLRKFIKDDPTKEIIDLPNINPTELEDETVIETPMDEVHCHYCKGIIEERSPMTHSSGRIYHLLCIYKE